MPPAGPPPSVGAQPLPVPPVPMEPVGSELAARPAPVMPSPPAPRTERATAPLPDGVPTTPPAALVTPPAALVTPPAPLTGQASRPAASFQPAHNPRPQQPRPAPESNGAEHGEGDQTERGATGPQLRRFIKSRAYVPMHELRRRFLINGGDDDVTPVDLGERRRVFVGLPEREGRLLGELLRGGDIGYELSLDPISPIVVGVYPMRPVTRA